MGEREEKYKMEDRSEWKGSGGVKDRQSEVGRLALILDEGEAYPLDKRHTHWMRDSHLQYLREVVLHRSPSKDDTVLHLQLEQRSAREGKEGCGDY